MSFLNLMRNKLKPREVNAALMSGSGSTLQHGTVTITGNGTTSYTVVFPHIPLFISIQGKALADEWCGTALVPYKSGHIPFITANRAVLGGSASLSQDSLTLTISTTGDAGYIANKDGSPIVVDYYYN